MITAMDTKPPDLEFEALMASPYVVITPRGHPLARRKSGASAADVAAYPQVANSRESHLGQLTALYLRQQGLSPAFAVTVDGWQAIKRCVEAGVGIAIVPALCVTERDEVACLRFTGEIPPRRYGRLTRRDPVVPLAITRFIRTADDVLGGNPHAMPSTTQ